MASIDITMKEYSTSEFELKSYGEEPPTKKARTIPSEEHGTGPMWLFAKGGGYYQVMTKWENKEFEKALSNGDGGVQYVWRTIEAMTGEKSYTDYQVNFDTMTQTNMITETSRRLLRVLPALA
jgi:hypothetical protein